MLRDLLGTIGGHLFHALGLLDAVRHVECSPTERRVVDQVISGLRGPATAGSLVLLPRTLQTHVCHALAKLGIKSRVELASVAARDGISSLPG